MTRKLKFIAWDTKNRILKRLGKVELIKGELILENHIILQFTGHTDKFGKEIYDGDVLLSNGEDKFRVIWNDETYAWSLEKNKKLKLFDTGFIASTTRLYNFHEKS